MTALTIVLTILSGTPTSIHDGDTLRLSGERVRLSGIDAPELRQVCLDGAGAPYPAGIASRDHLRALVGNRAITCTFEKRDRYGRAIGTCGGLNEAMVRAGWARAAYGVQYRADEATARAAHLGIWSGSCQNPGDWRRDRR